MVSLGNVSGEASRQCQRVNIENRQGLRRVDADPVLAGQHVRVWHVHVGDVAQVSTIACPVVLAIVRHEGVERGECLALHLCQLGEHFGHLGDGHQSLAASLLAVFAVGEGQGVLVEPSADSGKLAVDLFQVSGESAQRAHTGANWYGAVHPAL